MRRISIVRGFIAAGVLLATSSFADPGEVDKPAVVEPAPNVLTDAPSDTEAVVGLTPEDYLSSDELKTARPWTPPNYSGQTGALGWSETVFDVPANLKNRVAFWRDIYTKYTTDQGVIHDSVYINIVYAPIDFGEITRDITTTPRQKARLKTKLVKEKKKEITDRLLRLASLKSADGLTGEDLRTWKMFDSVGYADRFKDAAVKGRVRFQLGQRDKFIVGIFHSGRYLSQMEKIFRDEGLPIEITRLPFVESSFNIRARSRVGASGVWQFMRRTARPYMKVNRDSDERNDPLRATRASAHMLKSNYEMLGSWPLAITGYNHGPSGVKRIVERVKSRDLGEIVEKYESRTFGFASENFYACFLAALEAEKSAKKYFGEARWGPEIDAEEIRLTKAMPYSVLLQFFDGDKAAAELANPHFSQRFRKGRAPLPVRSYIRVPVRRKSIAEQWMKGQVSGAQLIQSLLNSPALKDAPDPATKDRNPAIVPTTRRPDDD